MISGLFIMVFSRHCLIMMKQLPFRCGNLRFQKLQNKLQQKKITLVSEWNQSCQPEAVTGPAGAAASDPAAPWAVW